VVPSNQVPTVDYEKLSSDKNLVVCKLSQVGSVAFSAGESCVHRVKPTKRAADGGYAPRFQVVFVPQSWFRQNGVILSRPPVPLRGITEAVGRKMIKCSSTLGREFKIPSVSG
jgi:hypothetical protein